MIYNPYVKDETPNVLDGQDTDIDKELDKDKELDIEEDKNKKIEWNKILVVWSDLPSPIKPIKAITDREKYKIKANIN